MQSQGGGVPESRYTMSYSHSALTGDGVDLYSHGPDPYILQHQHHIVGHGGQQGMSPTGHGGMGMGSPGQHHQHSSKRSAEVAGLNLKQDPMVGDVTMSTIGMGHSTMDDGGSSQPGGQNGSQTKKTPPPNGKKTKGRVKIKMEFIDNKLRRYTTFSKRKTGIMKKAYELSTLTGTQVMLLVASETGHVYTFATRKLQPMITSEAGKALIQTCLNSPDPPSSTVDQRMSATGFEETELTYTLHDEDQKEDSDSDEGEEGASTEGASRSPSPTPAADLDYSADESHGQPTRLVHPSRAPAGGANNGGGVGGGTGRAEQQPAVSTSYQMTSSMNGARQTTTTTSSTATSVNSTITNPSNDTGAPRPLNLTPSQLATIAANLPGLSSALSLPLPHGTNFASLLASASSLLTGGGGGRVLHAGSATKSPVASTESAGQQTRKHLPRLISLAHVGAALQPPSSSAKDATKTLLADQRNDNPALNLQTSTATRDKKGGGGTNKSRPGAKRSKK